MDIESQEDKDKENWVRTQYGGIAQLGEHLPCKQGVKSSNLFISTRTCHYGLIAQVVRARA